MKSHLPANFAASPASNRGRRVALIAPWLFLTLFEFQAPPAATQPTAAGTFSHDDWTAVLEQFVDERGAVDYRGLNDDRSRFDRYLLAVQTTSPDTHPELFTDRDAELAYWINAYNAQVFAGVLARGPEDKSVWSGGLISGRAFFVSMSIEVGRRKMSLKSLEDDIVRGRYKDPRVHAALNCASKSCPRLPRQAFTGPELDQQLEAAMREFANEDRNCRIGSGGTTVELSKIFDWFEADFLEYERAHGSRKPRVVDYVNRFRNNEAIPQNAKVVFIPYDKSINRQ